jgi:uncharacterized protein DUF1559
VCRVRAGLTILEVVVLLLVALVLLGVVLNVMNRSRGVAHQAVCANNMRILGEGLFHYQGGVPEMFLEEGFPGPSLPAARIAPGYATWAVELAPYVAAQGTLKNWDMALPYADQPASVRQDAIAVYLCPTRLRSQAISIEGDVPEHGEGHRAGAVGDYACASGDGDPKCPYDTELANGAIILGQVLKREKRRILRWQSRTEYADLTRGLSNTILLGEKHVPLDGFGKASSGDGSIYNGGKVASFARVGGPGFGLAQSPAEPFTRPIFGSYHPGLCQFLMADYSVRPLANGIDEGVLGQLIRRN